MHHYGLKATLVAGLTAISVLFVNAAQAADNIYEDMYKHYHRAKRVAELCRGLTVDQTQAAALGRVIDAKTQHQIGGGRSLTLLYQAKSEARDIVDRQGCQSTDAQTLMQVYDTELAPALNQ